MAALVAPVWTTTAQVHSTQSTQSNTVKLVSVNKSWPATRGRTQPTPRVSCCTCRHRNAGAASRCRQAASPCRRSSGTLVHQCAQTGMQDSATVALQRRPYTREGHRHEQCTPATASDVPPRVAPDFSRHVVTQSKCSTRKQVEHAHTGILRPTPFKQIAQSYVPCKAWHTSQATIHSDLTYARGVAQSRTRSGSGEEGAGKSGGDKRTWIVPWTVRPE